MAIARVPTFGERVVRELGIALLFLALATLSTWPLVLDLRERTLDGRDPLIDLWTLHWLSDHAFEPSQIFQGNIFHPAPHAVLRNVLSLDTALLVVPFRVFIDDPVPLYNLGLLLALAFGGWAFHTLGRELTGSVSAGLLSGILAAFGSHQLSHVYHLNRLSIGFLALFLLGLHRLLRAPGIWPVVLAGVSFSLTAQSSGYYAAAAAILGLVFAGLHWRAFRAARVIEAGLAAALLALLLTAPYARAFLELRAQDGIKRPLSISEELAFRPARDLTSRSYLYGALLGAQGQRLFPGLLSLILAACAVLRRRESAGLYLGATVVLLMFSIGPRLTLGGTTFALPYRWLFAVPPLDAMRHPYTFAAVALFTLSVLAAIGWAGLRLAARPWAGALLVLLAIAETLGPPPDLRRVPAGVPPAYRALERLPPGPILEVPIYDPYALVWAARHGRPVVNGVNAFVPPRTALLELVMRHQWLKRVPQDVDETEPTRLLVEEFSVRYVILSTGRRPHLRGLAAAFDRSRTFALVAEAANGDRVYEVVPVGRAQPIRASDGKMRAK